MKLEAVYHRPKQNWCYMYDVNTVHIRIRAKRGDMQSIHVFIADKYEFESSLTPVPMRVFASDALFDYWEAAVRPPNSRLQYYFGMTSGPRTVYMNENGFSRKPPNGVAGLFEYPFLHYSDALQAPDWVKEAVFYQIFPDRFANGDPANDPDGTEPWGEMPTPSNFFGGDLQGVIDHLDHLSVLGINVIYFTPVFEATTNHKYDTRDYMKVDPQFGTNETMKQLVEACHARGIRVLLDAVFNHSGGTFAPFLDVVKNGECSPYKDWFHIKQFPALVHSGKPSYHAFAFEPHMPKLNTQHPEVKAYLLEAARYWIEDIGADGWRLDVANEVDHRFWRDFRDVVKKANKDAYILGEVWHDSMMWLQGDQFDAVTNYPFTNAVLDFFARRTIQADEFHNRINAQLAAYPQSVREAAFNLLDSHDTPRLLTLCRNNKAVMKLAALFQLTFPGAPCIYYGDEIGMSGAGDPDCRKCMEWEPAKQDRELLEFYRTTIALRKTYAALRTGTFRFLQAEKKNPVIAYEREDERYRFLIVMNNDAKEGVFQLPEPRTHWNDALSGGNFVAAHADELILPPYGYKILFSNQPGL
ncbi:alpha-glycosidase [Paenibacillus tarimensis]